MSDTTTARMIYFLFLAGWFFPIVTVIGLIMAYVNKGDAPDWVRSHYQYQIRTFWWTLVWCVLGMFFISIVFPYFIGILLLIVIVFWFIYRCIKGLKYLGKEKTIM